MSTMTTCLAAAISVATLPALAQSGVPTTRTDLQSAAPTARSAPDGGKVYDYPPNTGAILRPQDRTPYDVQPGDPQSKSSRAVPTGPNTNPSQKPAEQVGR